MRDRNPKPSYLPAGGRLRANEPPLLQRSSEQLAGLAREGTTFPVTETSRVTRLTQTARSQSVGEEAEGIWLLLQPHC